jgi:putative serine protease PepD
MSTMTPAPRSLVVLGAALALGAGGGAGAFAVLGKPTTTTTTIAQPSSPAPVADIATPSALSVGEIYRRTRQSVVDIKTTSTNAGGGPFGGGSQSSSGEGTGFVLDKSGNIVTNEHVVSGADTLQVVFADGRKATAKVVGKDASSDVAVIHVDVPASGLTPATFADSGKARVGDPVVAIGTPYGLAGTVTTGIISALNRSITSPSNYTISGALQTDAAINPGNSGGPLLNAAGNVLGMNAQIESSSTGNTGVGFAIAANTVRRVAQELAAGKTASHAYLGLSLGDATDGARVASVRSGSPAAAAGLKTGDVIVAIDGTHVSSGDAAAGAIDARSPGDKITLTVQRNGGRSSVGATLGTRPSA